MNKRKKRKFYLEFKAKVAVEAIKNPHTLAKLSYSSDHLHLDL